MIIIQKSKVPACAGRKMQNHNSKVKSDLKIRCYHFSIKLIKFIDFLPNQRSCYILVNQLLRAGTSIGANLVEATASSSRIEFKKFHEVSLKSANETKYWLGLLRDTNKGDKNKINELLAEVTEISNMLAAGILKLKGKK